MTTSRFTDEEIKQLQQSDEEKELFRLSNVTLIRGSTNLGSGELLLTSKNVNWNGQNDRICISFLAVGLSAIMRNAEQPCLYCQVDRLPEDINNTNNNNHENGDEMDDEEDENEHHVFEDDSFSELRFIPTETSRITEIYDNFCLGALLNPEPETSDGEGELYYGNNDMDEDYDEDDDEDSENQGGDDINMMKPDQVDDLVRYENPEEDQ